MKSIFLSFSIGLAAAVPASAALVTVTFDDIAAGDISGRSGGTGLSGNWTGTTTILAVSNNLTAPSSTGYAIATTGTAQSVQGTNPGFRQVTRSITDTMTGEIWFSFLASNPSTTASAGITFNSSGNAPTTPAVGVFLTGNQLSVGFNSGVVGTGDTVTAGTVALILGRLVINASGNETLSVWLNPSVTGGISGLGAADAGYSADVTALNSGLNLFGASSYRGSGVGGVLDSIRFSNATDPNQAFLDVTTIPEPASALLALGGIALAVRRRR